MIEFVFNEGGEAPFAPVIVVVEEEITDIGEYVKCLSAIAIGVEQSGAVDVQDGGGTVVLDGTGEVAQGAVVLVILEKTLARPKYPIGFL